MRRVLVYENRKTNGPLIWDVSSPELERGAFLGLFNYLDKEWGVYDFEDLQEPSISLNLEQISKLPEGRVKEEALKEHKERNVRLYEFHKSQLQQKLYERSKAGDVNAVKKLLTQRESYEYEHWTLCDVTSKET